MKNSPLKGRARLALVIDLESYSAESFGCGARAHCSFPFWVSYNASRSRASSSLPTQRGARPDRLDLSGKPVALDIVLANKNKKTISFNLSRGELGRALSGTQGISG